MQGCDWRAKKRATRFFFENGKKYFLENHYKIYSICYGLVSNT